MKKVAGLLAICLFAAIASYSQIREIPQAVKDAFRAQYDSASNIEYKDFLATVAVHFMLNGQHMIAKYDNKGAWKETEKEASFDGLLQEVKDGFSKSKYADWDVEETAIITMPANEERYRVKVSKSDVQKKYLYFNKNGRLVRDAITL